MAYFITIILPLLLLVPTVDLSWMFSENLVVFLEVKPTKDGGPQEFLIVMLVYTRQITSQESDLEETLGIILYTVLIPGISSN